MLFWMIVSSVIAGLGGLAIYVYYLRSGQFEEPESVKYQLFREDNPDS
jgi:cbb3-type cytochrome oxidase maturation protein